MKATTKKKVTRTYYCPFDGCNVTSPSVPGLSAHMRLGPHEKEWKGTVAATLEALGLSKEALLIDRRRNGLLPDEVMPVAEKPTKRPYQRKLQRAAKRSATRAFVHFCPRCGFDLEPVSISIGFQG